MKKLIFFGVLGLSLPLVIVPSHIHTTSMIMRRKDIIMPQKITTTAPTGMNPVKGTVTKQQAATSKRPKHIVTRSSFRK